MDFNYFLIKGKELIYAREFLGVCQRVYFVVVSCLTVPHRGEIIQRSPAFLSFVI